MEEGQPLKPKHSFPELLSSAAIVPWWSNSCNQIVLEASREIDREVAIKHFFLLNKGKYVNGYTFDQQVFDPGIVVNIGALRWTRLLITIHSPAKCLDGFADVFDFSLCNKSIQNVFFSSMPC